VPWVKKRCLRVLCTYIARVNPHVDQRPTEERRGHTSSRVEGGAIIGSTTTDASETGRSNLLLELPMFLLLIFVNLTL
jgi:hypothetical protein